MYKELERHMEGFFKGQLTDEQKEKLMDTEDAKQHFIDLLNVHPLFEGRIECFKAILVEAGWEKEAVLKIYREASSRTNWNNNRKIITEIIHQGKYKVDGGRLQEHSMGQGRF